MINNSDSDYIKSKVICIMGPTASGKTSLAIDAAHRLNGEVISVDSALIYRDMDIGTAKPDEQEKKGIEHHLIDILSPEQTYSVSDFLKDAERCIIEIIAKGKTPILAGGTMMYFNALINGINDLPATNKDVREKLLNVPLNDIYDQLQEVDPVSAKRIHASDSQRLIRALEVYLSTNKSLTQWQSQETKGLDYDFCQFSIMPTERSRLHNLIEQRFDNMLDAGFVNEVERLLEKYSLLPDMPSMRSVGYRQVWQYLRGELKHGEMRERGVIATRQLAKRQITWLRGWPAITQLYSEDNNNVRFLVQKVGAT